MFRKLFLVCLLVLALGVQSYVPITTVVTHAFNDPNQWWEDLAREIERLQRENDELRNQLQATPPPPQAPMVRLTGPNTITVMPGEEIVVPINVRNIGAGTAHSVLTQANADGPFVVEFLNNTNTISSLSQNGQRNMSMRITVDANAEPGNYAIELSHHFRNNAAVNSTSTDTIVVRVGGEAGASNIRLSNIRTSTAMVTPGQSFTVTADLHNAGNLAANNLQVSVGNLSPTTVFLTSDLSNAFFSTFDAEHTTQVSFTFQAARNMASSVHQLDFRLTYDGASERAPTAFFITVLSDYATESPNIEMRNLTAPTGRLNVSQAGMISFELANTGDAVAQNIRVTATSLDATALVPTVHSNRQTLQSLPVDGTSRFEFGFMPTASSQSQSYAVQLMVEYSIIGAEEPSSFVQYVALNVHNPEAVPTPTPEPGGVQIPRMIVRTYELYPQIPRAGRNFGMEISFLNTSSTRAVNNIRVTLNSAEAAGGTGTNVAHGAVFTPVGGSNTLFIPNLAPGQYITKDITMFTMPDAAPRVYTLDVVFDFQDDEYVEHTMSERLSIPVAQDARLELDPPELFIPEMTDMWSFIEFEFSVINTGRVNLRNTWVRIEGPFNTREGNIFMSTIAAGRTHFYRGRIQPLEAGLLEGAIVVSGEDDAGEITEIRYEFSVYVMGDMGGMGFEGDYMGDMHGRFPGDYDMHEGGAMGRPGFEMWDDPYGESDGFMSRPLLIASILGAVVAIAGVVVFLVLKRKKSALSFDDDFGSN